MVIPGHTDHCGHELEIKMSHLIFRPDPDSRLTLW